MNPYPLADYKTSLLDFLKLKEGFKGGLPYIDTSTKHLATIGFARRKRCQEPLSDLTVVD